VLRYKPLVSLREGILRTGKSYRKGEEKKVV
jgi:hypothetical protein